MSHIKNYSSWKLLNEDGGGWISKDLQSMRGEYKENTVNPSSSKIENTETPAVNPSQNLNRTPTKSYEDVKSGSLDLHQDSFKILIDANRISTSDLLKTGSNYIPELSKIKDDNLKEFLGKLTTSDRPDLTLAYKKFNSGEWSVSPLDRNGKEMYIFDWVPVDSQFKEFKLRSAKSSRFGGKISWIFTDNMWYPVISKSDPDIKGVLNGFVNGANDKVTHSFKPNDVVYVKMYSESLERLDATQKASMEWCSGLQYITKMIKNDTEHSSIFTSNPDSVAIDRQRGPNTAVVPGYIVLVERENVGSVSRSDKSYGFIQGEGYQGLVI